MWLQHMNKWLMYSLYYDLSQLQTNIGYFGETRRGAKVSGFVSLFTYFIVLVQFIWILRILDGLVPAFALSCLSQSVKLIISETISSILLHFIFG